jgi:hypothetical protein
VGETYKWYLSNATVADQSFGTGPSDTDYPMVNTTYSVEADDRVSFEKLIAAQVTVCAPPTVSLPADRTIAPNTSTTITASASGAAPLQYQWYTVSGGVATAMSGATSSSLTVTPTQTTTYRLTVTNNCGPASDDIVIVVAGSPPSVPVMRYASYNAATGNNEVSWFPSSSASGIDHYVIERMPERLIMTAAAQYTTIYDQVGVVAGRSYVYRVKAVDVNNVSSDFSSRDLTTRMTFKDDPVRAPSDNGGTLIQGAHVAELRKAVDAVRAAAGLAAAWSNYSVPTGPVYASHFLELRDRLNEARRALLLPDVVFTDSVTAYQAIRGRSVTELRNGVK